MRLTQDKGQSVFLNNRSIRLQTKLLSWLEVDLKDGLYVGKYIIIGNNSFSYCKKNIILSVQKYYLNISIIYISLRFYLSIEFN